MIWGRGDGSDMRAVDSAVGRIGQLACWEHYLPLARHALIAHDEQIDSAYPWLLCRLTLHRPDGNQHPSACARIGLLCCQRHSVARCPISDCCRAAARRQLVTSPLYSMSRSPAARGCSAKSPLPCTEERRAVMRRSRIVSFPAHNICGRRDLRSKA